MKLLVTDYDNTYELHYESLDCKSIFDKNISSVNEFMKNNIFVIATGRHSNAIKKTIDENKLKFDYLICNNGAELYDSTFKCIYYKAINKSDLIKIMKLKKYGCHLRSPFGLNEITSVNFYIDSINDYQFLKEFLNKNLKSSKIEFKFPKIKIYNSSCDKIDGVEQIIKMENINFNNVYTIGDDVNDYRMVKKYNGCSLDNSINKIKECSLYNCDTLSSFIKIISNESK